ncbi:unnamed protein product [Nezara viridula]|uniref:Uncharacterized protein n=1 Tax=Nezara viridula TaxID=85310 RepID=A0A9P0MXZ0_NEZVI|nr:unnamed protein product [Nezara viridula]
MLCVCQQLNLASSDPPPFHHHSRKCRCCDSRARMVFHPSHPPHHLHFPDPNHPDPGFDDLGSSNIKRTYDKPSMREGRRTPASSLFPCPAVAVPPLALTCASCP